jgi:hypothetical protein
VSPSNQVSYAVQIPPDVRSYDAFLGYAELRMFHRRLGVTWAPQNWNVADFPKYARQGRKVTFWFEASFIQENGGKDPKEVAERPKPRSPGYDKIQGEDKEAVNRAIDERYRDVTGAGEGEKIQPGERSKADLWNMYRDDVLKDRDKVAQ